MFHVPSHVLACLMCFLQILRLLSDPALDLVLTPQFFTNVSPHADAFNHLNPQFW
jgi:hypothetical protein